MFSLIRKLLALVEGVISWCVGFLLTGCLFIFLILYIIPLATRIPLDADKYIARATARIVEIRQRAPFPAAVSEERYPPLSENVFRAVDKAADNLIKWINQKPN